MSFSQSWQWNLLLPYVLIISILYLYHDSDTIHYILTGKLLIRLWMPQRITSENNETSGPCWRDSSTSYLCIASSHEMIWDECRTENKTTTLLCKTWGKWICMSFHVKLSETISLQEESRKWWAPEKRERAALWGCDHFFLWDNGNYANEDSAFKTLTQVMQITKVLDTR